MPALRTVEDGGQINLGAVRGPEGRPGPAGAGVPAITAADVGKVLAVGTDQAAEWRAVEPAAGSPEWETIDEIVLPEAVSSFTVSVDRDGNPFELDEVSVLVDYPFSEESRERVDIYYNVCTASDAWGNFKIMDQQAWVYVIEYSAALGCARHAGYQYGTTLVAARCGFLSKAKEDGLLYHTPADTVRLTGNLAEGTRIVIAGRRSRQ